MARKAKTKAKKPSKPKARATKRPSPPAQPPKARPPTRLELYAKNRLAGKRRVAAVKAAGYRPKNNRNAAAMARRMDQQLRDQGELDQAFLDSGITQKTIAEVMLDGLEAVTYDQIGLEIPDTRTRVLTAGKLGHWLGYDDRAEKGDEGDQAGGGNYDERQEIRDAITKEIYTRKAGGHAGRARSTG